MLQRHLAYHLLIVPQGIETTIKTRGEEQGQLLIVPQGIETYQERLYQQNLKYS